MERPVQSVTRACSPGKISQNIKETVAQSLLNDVYRRVSGDGDYGAIVIGEKPSDYFSSGFLVALNPEGDTDGVDRIEDLESSPIRIGATGMDIGIKSDLNDMVRLKAFFSLYMRVLPTSEDLRKDRHPVKFALAANARKSINEEIRNQCQAEKQNYNLQTAKGRESWKKKETEIRKDINKSYGIDWEPVEAIPADEEDAEQEINHPEETIGIDIFTISPGDRPMAKDDLFASTAPVSKWIRINVATPEVTFYPNDTKEAIQEIVKRANDELAVVVRQAINQWLESDDSTTGGRYWAFPKKQTFTPSEIRGWEQTLQRIRQKTLSMPLEQKKSKIALPLKYLDIRWAVEIQDDWSDPKRKSLHVALENWSKLPQKDYLETEQSIFQCKITGIVPEPLHYPMKLERIKPSYRYNKYLEYPALGFNSGINYEKKDSHIFLETTWLPKYSLPRIDPQQHGIDTSFAGFSDPDGCVNQGIKLVNTLQNYIEDLKKTIDVTQGLKSDQTEEIEAEKKAFRKDIEKWTQEAKMIKRGVDMLDESRKADPDSSGFAPFRAFQLMNFTMGNIAGEKYKDWRLFQIAFILASLPALASRIPACSKYHRPEWDGSTTLLYFATGGGKTEAFLGLLVFGLFMDRLRGKGRGVTAMIRYPLRLLTIQQAQRAAKFLAEAEKLRIQEKIPGDSFRIGFWVGGSNTPNSVRNNTEFNQSVPIFEQNPKAEEKLRQSRTYMLACQKWVKLVECPFCGHAPVGIRRFPNLGDQAGYICLNENCWWNHHNPHAPLPFHFVDDDIYALSPSVLLGTVDKLALIGQHYNTIRKVLGMLGGATWIDPATGLLHDAMLQRESLKAGPEATGMKGVFPAYRSGERVFFDPFPSLIIQDEAHLLEESLGTFAGLFETALNEIFRRLGEKMDDLLCRDAQGSIRMPKVVVASATVSEPERQIEYLYQQNLIQFPFPGPDLYWSFYAAPKDRDGNFLDRTSGIEVETRSMKRRVYASILTNGKPHTTATVNILSAFHVNITRLMCDLGSGNPVRHQRGKEALMASVPPGALQTEYREAVEKAGASELATMVDLHRVALTYVTNKKGGDQIMSAEDQQVLEDHKKQGFDLGEQFSRDLITGSVDVARIKNIVDRIEQRSRPGEFFEPITDVIRSVVATSAVSHGVDVEELNSMFFAGMPSDIAEYIQASSRVGRTHVGISLLIPIPQRKRDRYIVEIHDIFHRFLERMVKPAAIDRWAENAITRVVPSFFQCWLCGVRTILEFIDRAENEKQHVRPCIMVGQITSMNRQYLQEQVVDFITHAIGLYTQFSPKDSISFHEDLIKQRVRDLLDDIYSPANAPLNLREFFTEINRGNIGTLIKPMTSLRDVDLPALLSPRKSASKLKEEEFNELMRFLLRGAGATIDDYQTP